MKNKTNVTDEAAQLMEDAQVLLDATAHVAGEKVAAARRRLATAVQNGDELLDQARAQAVAGAKAADQVIRDHPYHAIGLALGAGALLGLLLARRD